MQSLEKRVSALEAVQPTEQFHAVLMLTDETEAECRQRHGIAADVANILFIQLVSLQSSSHAKP